MFNNLCYESQVYVATGRNKLISVIRLCHGFSAADKFSMPKYFLYVQIMHILNTHFYHNKNILSSPYGVHFNAYSLIY